jgi:hypothetical protein
MTIVDLTTEHAWWLPDGSSYAKIQDDDVMGVVGVTGFAGRRKIFVLSHEEHPA